MTWESEQPLGPCQIGNIDLHMNMERKNELCKLYFSWAKHCSPAEKQWDIDQIQAYFKKNQCSWTQCQVSTMAPSLDPQGRFLHCHTGADTVTQQVPHSAECKFKPLMLHFWFRPLLRYLRKLVNAWATCKGHSNTFLGSWPTSAIVAI